MDDAEVDRRLKERRVPTMKDMWRPATGWSTQSGTYGGVLASWSTLDGSARYIRPTVVERPFPVPVRRGAATLVAPEDRIAASFGLQVDGGRYSRECVGTQSLLRMSALTLFEVLPAHA